MADLILNILYAVIYFLTAWIAASAAAFLKEKFGTEKLKKYSSELQLKQDLAILAVKFAEQAYKEYDGKQKYDHAATWLSSRASYLKLDISPDEVKGLIEAALRSLKDQFGEAWAEFAPKNK